MEIAYLQQALDDLEYWKQSGNNAIRKKISDLINNIEETPYAGIGKPEALKHHLTGKWARRINKEHRLVYEVSNDTIYISSLKGHYK